MITVYAENLLNNHNADNVSSICKQGVSVVKTNKRRIAKLDWNN